MIKNRVSRNTIEWKKYSFAIPGEDREVVNKCAA